jgi:hypothetical protein
MTRRLWPLIAAIGLLLAWHAFAPERAPHRGAAVSPQARAPASARRAPSPPGPDTRPQPSFGARKTGIAACDDLVERVLACAELPDDARIAVAEASKAWAESGERAALEASCRDTSVVQAQALAAIGC